jgi:hypothetical protein
MAFKMLCRKMKETHINLPGQSFGCIVSLQESYSSLEKCKWPVVAAIHGTLQQSMLLEKDHDCCQFFHFIST